MVNQVVRFINNYRGAGFSGCGICGDKWSWKKEHAIPYDKNNGVFPVCEECWQTKSNEEIMRATKDLMEKWLVQSPAHYYKDTQKKVRKVLLAIEKALLERRIVIAQKIQRKQRY